MAKKLFVGNISYTSTEDALSQLFGEIGKVVSVNIIKDKFSGKSKGFGFVEMDSEEDAEKAIKELNGKEIDGRKIVVAEARPMKNEAQS